jgi:hypothetical protein
MSFTTITLTGTYVNPDATPGVGTVSLQLTDTMRNAGQIIDRGVQTVSLVSGAFSIALAANDDAGTLPVGVAYQVVESVSGESKSYNIILPSASLAGTVDLSVLVPTTTVPNLSYIVSPPATTGQILQWSGTAWVAASAGSGNATSLQSRALSATAPTTGQVIAWNGTSWAPAAAGGGSFSALTGDATSTGTGGATSVVKVQNVALTAAQATLVSQLNNGIVRTTATTVAPGEETIWTGAGSSILLLPGNTTQNSTINTILNLSGGTLSITATVGTTINYSGTVGGIANIPNNGCFSFVLVGTVWYVTASNVLAGDATGQGGAVVVGQLNGTSLAALGTGLVKNTTGTGVPSIAVAGTDFVAPGGALGTPSSATLTNATGLPESGVVNLTTDLAAKAPIASPTFTGAVTASGTLIATGNATLNGDLTLPTATYVGATNSLTGGGIRSGIGISIANSFTQTSGIVSTTIGAGQTTITLSSVPGTITLTSTTGIPASGGKLYATSSTGKAIINFTGVSGSTITGCTLDASSPTSGAATVSANAGAEIYTTDPFTGTAVLVANARVINYTTSTFGVAPYSVALVPNPASAIFLAPAVSPRAVIQIEEWVQFTATSGGVSGLLGLGPAFQTNSTYSNVSGAAINLASPEGFVNAPNVVANAAACLYPAPSNNFNQPGQGQGWDIGFWDGVNHYINGAGTLGGVQTVSFVSTSFMIGATGPLRLGFYAADSTNSFSGKYTTFVGFLAGRFPGINNPDTNGNLLVLPYSADTNSVGIMNASSTVFPTQGVQTTTSTVVANVTAVSAATWTLASVTGISTAGGTIYAQTTTGLATFNFTGVSGSTITGVTYVSGTGAIASGNLIYVNHIAVAAGFTFSATQVKTTHLTLASSANVTSATGSAVLPTPSLSVGWGQWLIITNGNVPGGNAITFANGTTPNLSLGASFRVLQPGGSLSLMFDHSAAKWCETGFSSGSGNGNYGYVSAAANTALIASTATTILTTPTLLPGVYQVNFTLTARGVAGPIEGWVAAGTATVVMLQRPAAAAESTVSDNQSCSGTGLIQVTAAGTLTLQAESTVATTVRQTIAISANGNATGLNYNQIA